MSACELAEDPFADTPSQPENDDPASVWALANNRDVPSILTATDQGKPPPPTQVKILQRKKPPTKVAQSRPHEVHDRNGSNSIGSGGGDGTIQSTIGDLTAPDALVNTTNAPSHNLNALIKLKEEQYQRARERIFGSEDLVNSTVSTYPTLGGIDGPTWLSTDRGVVSGSQSHRRFSQTSSGYNGSYSGMGGPLSAVTGGRRVGYNHGTTNGARQIDGGFYETPRHELTLTQLFEISAQLPPIAIVNIPGVPRWTIPPPPAVEQLLAVVGDTSLSLSVGKGVAGHPPPPPFPLLPLPPSRLQRFTPLPAFHTTLEDAFEHMTIVSDSSNLFDPSGEYMYQRTMLPPSLYQLNHQQQQQVYQQHRPLSNDTYHSSGVGMNSVSGGGGGSVSSATSVSPWGSTLFPDQFIPSQQRRAYGSTSSMSGYSLPSTLSLPHHAHPYAQVFQPLSQDTPLSPFVPPDNTNGNSQGPYRLGMPAAIGSPPTLFAGRGRGVLWSPGTIGVTGNSNSVADSWTDSSQKSAYASRAM